MTVNISRLEISGPIMIGDTIVEAPGVLYRAPGGYLTTHPNGAPVCNVVAGTGDPVLDGVTVTDLSELFRKPIGGLTTEPNGASYPRSRLSHDVLAVATVLTIGGTLLTVQGTALTISGV